jgi:hypothetical protein
MSAAYMIFNGSPTPWNEDEDEKGEIDDAIPTWTPLDAARVVETLERHLGAHIASGSRETYLDRPGISATFNWDTEPEPDGQLRKLLIQLRAGDEQSFSSDLAKTLAALLDIAADLDGVLWSTFSERALTRNDVSLAKAGNTP